MALIDKASLLMVPSVYEDGTLYNVLPSGNKAPDETGNHNGYDQTRADFTFSRGSNLAATRVNANGLIEKGRENLLLQSNQFDTTWGNANSSETSGQADKDGGTNAWKIDISGAGGRIYQSVSQSGVSTYSIYAKAGSLNWIILSSNIVDASFDLSNGVKGTLVGGISSSIESVGGGWYRCSASLNGSLTQVRVYPSNADNDFTSTSGNIYIQDAQLEAGLVATPYIETGATTATAGVLENTPRIDYSSGAGALLLEPQRTNSIAHSEYFSAWNLSGGTLTANATTSPEGVENAYLYTEDTSTNYHRLNIGASATNSNKVYSVYAKWAGGTGNKWLTIDNGPTAWFDIENGVKGNASGSVQTSIEPVGNGWYRCIYYNPVSTTGGIYVGIASSNGGAGNHIGSGQPAFYVYGAQCEDNVTYVSSYVPTYGSAATRGADSCSVTGASDVIGQTEGTLYYDWIMNHESPNTSEDLYTLTLSDGSGNKMIAINNYNNILAVFIIDTTTQFSDNSYTGGADGARIKLALAYANNDIALYINGTQIATDSSATIPTLNQVRLNAFWSGGAQDNTSVKQLALFNERLSNTELATLTTL